MSRLTRVAAATVAAGAALALGGCVSLLPKSPPVQLYRFSAPDAPTAPPAGASAAPGVNVALAGLTLPVSAAGDGILTVTGDEAAYVAGARWVSPAATLMDENLVRAFAGVRGVRLLSRSQASAAQAFLSLDVTRFETRYAQPGAAPTVVIELHVALASRTGAPMAERRIAVARPAAENRVSAIVAAYDAAVGDALGQVVGWTASAAGTVR